MTGDSWLHALLCIAVPCAIGLSMYVLFGIWDRRRQRKHSAAIPDVDYQI